MNIYETPEFKKALQELEEQMAKEKDPKKANEIFKKINDLYMNPPRNQKPFTIIKSPTNPEIKGEIDKPNQEVKPEQIKQMPKKPDKKGRFESKYDTRREQVKIAKGTSRKGKMRPGGARLDRKMKVTRSGPYNKPIFMGQDKNIHLPGSPVSNYVMRHRARNKILNRLAGGISTAAEFAERYSVPLTIATEALSSDDLNIGEDYELEQMKNEIDREEFLDEQFEGDEEKIKDFKIKEQEMLRTPVRPSDLLNTSENPEIKKSTIVPELASSEEEDDASMEDYYKKMKQKLGYS